MENGKKIQHKNHGENVCLQFVIVTILVNLIGVTICLMPVGEDTGESLEPQCHDLTSRACAFGYQVLFSGKEDYLVCVSCDSTVLAVLLSWSLSPCLKGLKVMGMDDFPLGKWCFGFS